MGPKLLVLNRISRCSAQAVLAIPRIGRRGHKSNCFMGISTSLSSPQGRTLFFSAQCMQTFPLSAAFAGAWSRTEVLGLCSWGAGTAARHVPQEMLASKGPLWGFAVRKAAEAQQQAGPYSNV